MNKIMTRGMESDSGEDGNIIPIIVIVLIVVMLGVVVYVFLNRNNTVETSGNRGTNQESNNSGSNIVRWEIASDGQYHASSTPPSCPALPMLAMPVDISRVVSVLYPGQYRGGNYKPHGGLRFADGDNNIDVKLPMDASVVDGSRYLVDGEVQYLFDFVNSCGIKYRLGHLRTLSAPFAILADKLPTPQDMDSRTTQINPVIKFKAGDTVATAVGLLGEGNAFFDWGVYDLRQENEASKNASYQQEHSSDRDQAWHAICFFDLLPSSDATKLKSLPATSPGSQSDYCK